MQTNPAVEQNKTLNGPRVRGISPVGKEKVYRGKFISKSWHSDTLEAQPKCKQQEQKPERQDQDCTAKIE